MPKQKKLYTDQEWSILLIMSNVAEIIFGHIQKNHDFLLTDLRLENEVKITDCLTEKGLVLVVRKATQSPEKICSSLGEWPCFGGQIGKWDEIIYEVLNLFGAKEDRVDGSYKYYKLVRVNDLDVTDLGTTHDERSSYDEQTRKLKQLMARYRAMQKRKIKKA
jgi:hypothetical protein